MTANDPSRQQEAANHGDARIHMGKTSCVECATRAPAISTSSMEREHTLFHTLEERFKRGLINPSRCKGSHSYSLQERLFQTFHLDTPNDRSACAYGGVVDKKPQTDKTFGVGHRIVDFW